MPYIKQEMRSDILDEFGSIFEYVNQCYASGYLQDGEINYIITQIILALPHSRYHEMQKILGLLEAVKMEFYRKVVAPYEDKKCQENGEVYTI